MYYISDKESCLQISAIKKRLKDFWGVEGKEYHVRKKRDIGENLTHIRIYIYQDGKLRPTKSWSVFNLFK